MSRLTGLPPPPPPSSGARPEHQNHPDLPDLSGGPAAPQRKDHQLWAASRASFDDDSDLGVGGVEDAPDAATRSLSCSGSDEESSVRHRRSPEEPMTGSEFRKQAGLLLDYMVEYLESLSDRRVTPAVKPGKGCLFSCMSRWVWCVESVFGCRRPR